MTHTYDYPEWFWNAETTDEQRSEWMVQHRCYIQAKRQAEAAPEAFPTFRTIEKQIQRTQRRVEANSGTVNVEDYR